MQDTGLDLGHGAQGIREYLAKRPAEAEPMLKKLKYYAEAGFLRFEGEGQPVKHEWDGVYRVAWEGMFRILGFYEDESKRNFITTDAFLKRKTMLSRPERDKIDEVARVKREGDWKRRQPSGYPRFAKGSGRV